MNLQKLILELKSFLASVTLDAAKKTEVEAKIAALEAEAAKQPAEPAKKEDAQQVTLPNEVVVALAEIKTLKDMLLKQEQRASEAETAMQNRIKAEQAQKKADYIKKVTETDKKLSPAEWKEKYEALYDAAPDATMKVIDALSVHPASRQTKTTENKTGADAGEKNTSLKNYVDNKGSFDSQAIAAFTAPSTN
jgi:hypothetical protein